jgi:hypothetical protein
VAAPSFYWQLGGRDPYWKPEDLLDAELIALWIGHHDVLSPWLLDLLEYRRAEVAQPGEVGAPVLCSGVQIQVQSVLDGLGLWDLLEKKPPAQPCAGDLLDRVVGMPDGLQSSKRGLPGHRRDHALVDVPGGQQLSL